MRKPVPILGLTYSNFWRAAAASLESEGSVEAAGGADRGAGPPGWEQPSAAAAKARTTSPSGRVKGRPGLEPGAVWGLVVKSVPFLLIMVRHGVKLMPAT